MNVSWGGLLPFETAWLSSSGWKWYFVRTDMDRMSVRGPLFWSSASKLEQIFFVMVSATQGPQAGKVVCTDRIATSHKMLENII